MIKYHIKNQGVWFSGGIPVRNISEANHTNMVTIDETGKNTL